MIHFLNGQWVEDHKALISVFDLAVLRGYGCFDFTRTYNKKPFFINDHLERFFQSAKSLFLKPPYPKKALKNIILEGIEKNRTKTELNIRIILTGGIGPDSLSLGKPSLAILFTPVTPYPKNYYQKGVKVITYPGKRSQATTKSLDYLQAVLAYKKAKRKKAVEALYTFQGKIYEGTTSNFFVVLQKKIITPKKDVLLGVTRKVVIDLAKKLGFVVLEKSIYLKTLPLVQEAFICSSTKEIMPVVRIDNLLIGNGKVGPLTKKLMAGFLVLIKNY